MKKLFKILSMVLSVIIVLSFVGCGGNNNKKPDGSENNKEQTDSGVCPLPDYDLKKDELKVEIAGWVSPNSYSDEQVSYIVESGVNSMFLASAGTYPLNVNNPTKEDLEALSKLHDNGIRAYIHNGGKQADQISKVENFKDNPAVAGWVFDEPNKQQIIDLSRYVDNYNIVGNNKLLYVNLYPSYAKAMGEFYSYDEYVKFFVDNVLLKTTSEEKILSADRYPLTYDGKGNKALDIGWLTDIQTIATIAKEYEQSEKIDIRTNFFIQTMSYTSGQEHTAGQKGSRDRVPTYEDIRMQEYALMAFGYDSISLFCYGTPVVSNEFVEDNVALIDRDGNKTPIYEDCKKANHEILDFDHVIMQFDWKGNFCSDANVLTKGKPRRTNIDLNRMSIDEVSGLNSVKTTADTLFGYFLDNDENSGYMIVNYNETTLNLNNSVTLNFDPEYHYNKVRVYVEGKPVIKDVVNNSVTLDLGVGEGVFAIPYKTV